MLRSITQLRYCRISSILLPPFSSPHRPLGVTGHTEAAGRQEEASKKIRRLCATTTWILTKKEKWGQTRKYAAQKKLLVTPLVRRREEEIFWETEGRSGLGRHPAAVKTFFPDLLFPPLFALPELSSLVSCPGSSPPFPNEKSGGEKRREIGERNDTTSPLPPQKIQQ